METTGGVVVRGKGFGETLGFPTANIQLDPDSERPADGIYACWVTIGEWAVPSDGRASPKRWAGALHVGPRPAIGDPTPTIEVHLLDFDGREIYGQRLELEVVARLRDVQNFATTADLAAAIARDCAAARKLLT